ncbi:MAG: transposase [Arsenophonus sp.]
MKQKVKAELQKVYLAESCHDIPNKKAIDVLLGKFSEKYPPAAMKNLKKNWKELLALYNFLSEHLASIRTINPIELAFSTLMLLRKLTL